MGARNPDLIAPPPSPNGALTLGEMRDRRWTITAHCSTCRTRVHVDVEALMKLLGEDYILWGRRPRCKVWVRWNLDRRCEGRIEFIAQASQTGSAVVLKMSREVTEAIDLRSLAAASRR